jgi:hypothetical protein
MAEPSIQAHKIKSPIQLLAVWFAALVLIVSTFLTAAVYLSTPSWLAPTLVIAAILFVPFFLISAIVMQTKYRPQLQEDAYYAEWLYHQQILFHGFRPENTVTIDGPGPLPVTNQKWEHREQRRIERYQAQEGLFLIHTWRPSTKRGQVADIIIWLHQHKTGPLNRNEVGTVEYHLGPMFFTEPVIKRNREEAFKLEVSAYYPMLCIARAYLRNRSQPIELERYIDFDVPANDSQPED